MNTIRFENVVPKALRERINPKSDIWNNEISFNKGNNYLIKAVSGSGKSTFAQSLYGIRKDFEGLIFYDNHSINTFTDDDFSSYRKDEISIIFQDLRLFPQLTARENIYLKNSSDDLIENYAEQLGIKNLLDKSSAQLSFGEQQRVAIIRALVQNFDFLIADEPFSHLDEENGLKAFELMKSRANYLNASLIITSLGNEKYLQLEQTLVL